MIKSILFIAITLFPGFALANDGIMSAQVITVVDGNTVEVRTAENEVLTLILADIDCPELTQEYGDEAKKFLEKLALKKEVTIQIHGKDRKGNNVGVLLIKGKTDARIELLEKGLAWTSERNPKPELESVRTSAEKDGKGLWKDSNPTPPWTYRRQQSMLQPKSS
ncbi:MAG TPA: thermonuclease family protein [Chryseosolibacter sp.]